MSFKYDQFTNREKDQRMNRLLDSVIAEVRSSKPAVAFDSADDLLINPEHSSPYTTEELIADCKLAMLLKTPRERRQIAKDCKVLKRQLTEEHNNELAKVAEREANNRSALVCTSGNQAYASAFKRLNNISTEYRGNNLVRTFRAN